MLIVPKAIYILNAIAINIATTFFSNMDKVMLNLHAKDQHGGISV